MQLVEAATPSLRLETSLEYELDGQRETRTLTTEVATF